MYSITQSSMEVKQTPSQSSITLIELLDRTLARANHFHAEYLATGDPQAWRLWQAYQGDRTALLKEVGNGWINR